MTRIDMSSEDVPRHQRLAFIHDVVGRHAAGMSFAPLEAARFTARFSIVPLGAGAIASEACYDAFTATRNSELVADGRNDYQMLIGSAGLETEIEGEATLNVGAGDMLMIDQGARFITRTAATRYQVAILPRHELAALVPGLADRPYLTARRDSPGLALLAGYTSLLRREPPTTEEAARLTRDHLLKLAALTLSAGSQEQIRRHAPAVSSARLAMLKQTIRARLDDPELDIAMVARRHGISPRYLQQLFAQEGTSFSDFLRTERLERAFRRLDDGTRRDSIADIAFEAGFSDLSTFNRAFRRRYGCTPSDIRARAMRIRAN